MEDCPQYNDYMHVHHGWTCEDYELYESVLHTREICNWVTKSLQIAVFSILILCLIYKKFIGTGQIGKLTFVIAIFSLLNGIFSLLRVESVQPILDGLQGLKKYEFYYWVESIMFFGACWFFAIRYYETACDLQLMFSTDTSSASIKSRSSQSGRKFFRWVVFIIIFAAQTLESMSIAFNSLLEDKLQKVLYGIGFTVLSLLICAITILMAFAFYKFIKIVSRTSRSKRDINLVGTLVQIFSLIVWSSTWVAEGIIILEKAKEENAQAAYRTAEIIDGVGEIANLINFMIIAFVIYKSSKVFGDKHDEILRSNLSLLAYLRQQYAE